MKHCNTAVEQAHNKLQLLFSLKLGQVLWCTSWNSTDTDGSGTKKPGKAENPKLWKWRCRVRRLKAHLTCSWQSLQIPKGCYWCQDLDRANIIISQHKRGEDVPAWYLTGEGRGPCADAKKHYWFPTDPLLHIMLQGPPVFKNFCMGLPVSLTARSKL